MALASVIFFDMVNSLTDHADTLWQALSPDSRISPHLDLLGGETTADVVVVGAGFCGLNAAIELAEQGLQVVCVEANTVGWGASGRNNGQVIAGLKLDPDDVKQQCRGEEADKLIACAHRAPQQLFDFIRQRQIACDAKQSGWIQPARSKRALAQIEARVQQWQGYGADVHTLSPQQLPERLGTTWYSGAWLDKRGGSLNPLAYAQGLAKVALGLGVRLYVHSPVTQMQKSPKGWQVTTAQGKVKAKTLMLCSNAYTGALHPSFSKVAVPVRTAQMASVPLPDAQWRRILPKGEAASDTSRLLTSFRITPDKRLLMGGACATAGADNPRLYRWLYEAAQQRFPFLGHFRVAYRWSGYLAITQDHLPHIYPLAPDCYAAIGCNGRGIAMASSTGKELARYSLHQDPQQCAIPIRQADAFQLHALRHIGVAVSVGWNRLLDKSGI